MTYCTGKTFKGNSCPYKAVHGDKCGIHKMNFSTELQKVLPWTFGDKQNVLNIVKFLLALMYPESPRSVLDNGVFYDNGSFETEHISDGDTIQENS